jgi:DNA repair protein RecN (Recombination protein N)
MLTQLSVENFILIQHLELEFGDGFTCITGETGAGKSILLGALGLVLGQRADTQVLMDKSRKCIVEGTFSIKGYEMESLFEQNDLDFEINSTFRREITPQGKSRAFINDTPVNLSIMKEIGERLVDIHSQNQTLELNGAAFQLAMVDSYARCFDELHAFKTTFIRYQSLTAELESCLEKERKSNADREYFEFQLEELVNASLIPGEQLEAEAELELLNHAEEIKTKLYNALHLLEESDQNILSSLSEARQSVGLASRFSTQLESLAERLESSYIELKDITDEIRTVADHTNFDTERIGLLSARLDLIYHLEQKHKISSIEELIELRDGISLKLNEIGSLGERIDQLREELKALTEELKVRASQLSSKRAAVLSHIEKEMIAALGNLGMPSAKFVIQKENLNYFTHSGTDKVEFRFSANKGIEPREIQKIASGGELSRLMLAIKSLIVQRNLLPTLLFDEIDAGVSGEIAGKIGTIMKKMSANLQVITITHLPQIAAKAEQHMLVYKMEGEKSSFSNIRILNEDERVNEVARMLSDENITLTTKAAAREMMGF